MGPIALGQKIVNSQAWIQVLSVLLLVGLSVPWLDLEHTFSRGGRLPQWAGFTFLFYLLIYLRQLIRWGQSEDIAHPDREYNRALPIIILGAALLLAISSELLILSSAQLASRIGVPSSIVAVTLVALGTSTPELITAITAMRKGHGAIALGNVLGADILNVLLVAGAAAAITPGLWQRQAGVRSVRATLQPQRQTW